MIRVSDIPTRAELGIWLNARGLLGAAVEVGTNRGVFARQFLDVWTGEVMFCVDPWSVPSGYEAQAKTLEGSDGDRVADMKAAKELLAVHKDRVAYRRMLSTQAIHCFKPHSLDMVYLDGDHTPPHVADDIHMWWQKVRSSGILAGHDFAECEYSAYIQEAVFAHATRHNVDVHVVVERDRLPWSYYMVKNA